MKRKFSIVWFYLLFILINHKNSYYVSAKNIKTSNISNCHEHVSEFFKSFLNVTMEPSEKAGEICVGHCCSFQTEQEVLKKAVKIFEGNIKHQLKNIKSLWQSTYNVYKEHVLELAYQSENKTLTLFSTVYRRMSPLSRTPISELYKSIRSYIQVNKSLSHVGGSNNGGDELEAVIEKFFRNLFPLAYHHAVHSKNFESVSTHDTGEDEDINKSSIKRISDSRDFHIDYKNCLINSYETLQPFGEIPYSISRSLVQGVSLANVLLRALQHGADVLTDIENLPIESSLNTKCKHALLKMDYCSACKGHNYHHLKPCYGYCSNVIRGCIAQLIGGIDADWSSFSESTERLMTLVRSKDGIETVIKNLDTKLSEAIMHAMTNGPDLETKIYKTCGQPSIHPNEKIAPEEQINELDRKAPSLEMRQEHHSGISSSRWSLPPDTEMLQFLTVLDRFKTFSLQIANNYCEDDRYQKQNQNCWNGDHLGDYSHNVMDMHSQKYNPEVPTLQSTNNENDHTKFHKIIDTLITVKNIMNKQMTHFSRSDADKMFSDMAEDGSADDVNPESYVDSDDEDYGDNSGSGDHITQETPIIDINNVIPKAPEIISSSGSGLRISFVLLFNLVIPLYIVISLKMF